MNLWAFILIWYSTFSFLLNVGLRFTLGFSTKLKHDIIIMVKLIMDKGCHILQEIYTKKYLLTPSRIHVLNVSYQIFRLDLQ